MEFLGKISGTHMAGGGSGSAIWSGSSFGAQGPGVAQILNAGDLLKQVEQLVVMAEEVKIS